MGLVTLLPPIVYGALDLEYDKEALLMNPQMYQDGPQLLLYNNKLFAQWLVLAILQSAALYALCATVSGSAVEVFATAPFVGKLESGRIAGNSEMMSVLIFLVTCMTVISRLLFVDSAGLTLVFVSVCVTSMGLAVAYVQLVAYQQGRPELLSTMWRSPQVMLCLVGFVLASTAMQQFMRHYAANAEEREERFEMIEESYSKGSEKRRQEQE